MGTSAAKAVLYGPRRYWLRSTSNPPFPSTARAVGLLGCTRIQGCGASCRAMMSISIDPA